MLRAVPLPGLPLGGSQAGSTTLCWRLAGLWLLVAISGYCGALPQCTAWTYMNSKAKVAAARLVMSP